MLEYSLFERLSFRDQAEEIARSGNLLARRNYNNWQVTLYEYNNTFVELWQGNNAEVFCTFKNTASKVIIFEPYLSSVEVENLTDQL
jgi:hypothetical protein